MQRGLKVLLIFGCWTLLVVISAGQSYVNALAYGGASSWRENIAYAITEWYPWAALSPFIIWLSERYPFDRRQWRTRLLIHLPLGFVFPFLQLLIQACLWQWIAPMRFKEPSLGAMFILMVSRKFHISVLTYWAILGATHALRYYQNYRSEELERLRLSEQLTRAQMDALKMQLHPHFLFNTLNTITALIRRDPRTAERMVSRLSDLLRLTLENEAGTEVTLEQELEFLEKYLEIEQTRFHDRLIIDRRIDRNTLEARVPNMILQPIVENAVRHGIAKRAEAGLIRITAKRVDDLLHLQVCDDGYGPDTGADRTGVGLANTRARLEGLYGPNHCFEMCNAPDGGTEVSIIIPFHPVQTISSSDDRESR